MEFQTDLEIQAQLHTTSVMRAAAVYLKVAHEQARQTLTKFIRAVGVHKPMCFRLHDHGSAVNLTASWVAS